MRARVKFYTRVYSAELNRSDCDAACCGLCSFSFGIVALDDLDRIRPRQRIFVGFLDKMYSLNSHCGAEQGHVLYSHTTKTAELVDLQRYKYVVTDSRNKFCNSSNFFVLYKHI